MEQVEILRGKDAFNKGSGDGYGYGSGDGYGYGYGDGDGSGSGYGYGDGYGYGSGDGYGYGYGDGDGSGYGYGDGYGYGSGDGYGYGSGDGYGYGSGDGDGSGSGYGDGYGYGSGDGYGYGYGDGYGYGYGDGEYWRRCLKYFASKWGREQRERFTALTKAGAKICYWLSNEDGTPANGGRAPAVKAGDVQKIEGPLELCTKRALHATLIPPKWRGERVWIVALIGEVVGDDEKYGALEREIIGEAL